MKKLLIIFFLTSCVSSNTTNSTFNFHKDLSYNDFKELLKEYAIENAYPNIDN